jgi:1,2-diacylglycerol 3-alpha-glucosyltransferase
MLFGGIDTGAVRKSVSGAPDALKDSGLTTLMRTGPDGECAHKSTLEIRTGSDMRRYSVVMVAACPFPANYGTPGAIREMSETLADLGHDVHIVTYPFGDNLTVNGPKLWRTPYWRRHRTVYAGPSFEKVLLDFLLLITLCRVIRRQRISIIHAHNYEGMLIGYIAKLVTGASLLYNAVSLMSDELPSYRFVRPAVFAQGMARLLDWLAVKLPDYFIAITKDLRDFFVERRIPQERLALIPCGVKPEMFHNADAERFRAQYKIGDRPVVMYTGVNSPFQRLDYLLRAFQLVLLHEPAALLMVVSPLKGDPDAPGNRRLASSLGISSNVIWVEGQTLIDLPSYLAMAQVAVISRPNVPGHPIKLLNYMAAAKAIVCFAGAAKGVRNMHDAFVVPDHDLGALSQGIVTLLRDPDLARRLGAAAKATVERDFDWKNLCGAVEDVYGRIVAPVAVPSLEPATTPVLAERHILTKQESERV